MAKKFTKTEELDLLVKLRNSYESAMRAFFCNNDYHSEYFRKDVEDLLTTILEIKHKVEV